MTRPNINCCEWVIEVEKLSKIYVLLQLSSYYHRRFRKKIPIRKFPRGKEILGRQIRPGTLQKLYELQETKAKGLPLSEMMFSVWFDSQDLDKKR